MSACVSPPQLNTSHMVAVAAIIAQAASTALPPFWNVMAPAVAASGLPVIATQCWPCSGGFCVLAHAVSGVRDTTTSARNVEHHAAKRDCIVFSRYRLRGRELCCFFQQLHQLVQRIVERSGDTEVLTETCHITVQ